MNLQIEYLFYISFFLHDSEPLVRQALLNLSFGLSVQLLNCM